MGAAKMKTILLIPGIIGSKLKLGRNQIWPPNELEALTHYKRTKKLLDPRVLPSGIVDYVACFPVYSPLEKTLNSIARKTGANVEVFAYDWRKDWRETAVVLRLRLKKLAETNSQISIVAHSMGAMIARLALENPMQPASEMPRVKRLIAICAPHLGAPNALAKVLGLHGLADGIVSVKDTRKIANDVRYPSGYQLFTRPGHKVLFENGVYQDIYRAEVATKYGLSKENLTAAKETFLGFDDLSEKPDSCEYSFIYASGFETTDSLLTVDRKRFVEAVVDGDGTVPTWSTRPSASIRSYELQGEHLGVLKTAQCKALLHELFGLKPAKSKLTKDGAPSVALMVDKLAYNSREAIKILFVPSSTQRLVAGKYVLRRAEGVSIKRLRVHGTPITLNYEGPEFGSLSVSIRAPSDPGLYKLSYEGTYRTDDDSAAYFAVRKS